MGEHAILAPSSAEQWGHCSGSVLAQASIPNPDTKETREGTAAHWVWDMELQRIKRHGVRADGCLDYLGETAPNGVVIDEEMVDGAQVMVDDVVDVCQRLGGFDRLMLEFRVFMPAIHPTLNWGTLDAALYLPERGVLFLWDYKHGHREVVAEHNLQMIDYAAGLVELLQIDGAQAQQITAVFRVVRPRCYHARGAVNEWVTPLAELRAHWNHLSHMAHESQENPRLSTGPWCGDCRAVGKCAATRKAQYRFINVVEAPYEMDEMDGHDLAVERDILARGVSVAKKRLEAIEDELEHRVRSGDTSPGLVLEAKPGREVWSVEPAQAIALARQFGVDAARQDVDTPAQTLKKAPSALRPYLKQTMSKYTRRNAGKITLIRGDETIGARAFRRK